MPLGGQQVSLCHILSFLRPHHLFVECHTNSGMHRVKRTRGISMSQVLAPYDAISLYFHINNFTIDAVQRNEIALCLDLPQTPGRETMEVTSGLLYTCTNRP